eukprot:724839_1
MDHKLNFYSDTMDSLHFYLVHTFQCGLRSIVDKNKTTSMEQEHDEDKEEECVDSDEKMFAELNQSIKAFARYSSKTNKYVINTDDTTFMDTRTTFMDMLWQHLGTRRYRCNLRLQTIMNVIHLIASEEYDTDSIGSKLPSHVNAQCVNEIYRFVKTYEATSSSFSIGLRFYYWENGRYPQPLPWNQNYHSGEKIEDLFVKQPPKYSNLKDEMLQYEQLKHSISIVHGIMEKISKLKDTAVFKSIKAASGLCKYYGIAKGSPLNDEHLISLVLYTDNSALSSDFTSSFRKKSLKFDSLESVKKRNSKYWWWSKTLRETVELYGKCRQGNWDENQGINIDILKGPYYSGMSSAMPVPECNIRLCSPTSTSKHIETAIKFCGTYGMIMQLNNPHTQQYQMLRGFECDWISHFPEEDEVLFFGGYYRIKIESIIIRKTKNNLKEFIGALYYLDVMITAGTDLDKIRVGDKAVAEISGLMNSIVDRTGNINNTFHDYKYSTFMSFTQHKQQIILDLDRLRTANKMRDLILYSLEPRKAMVEKK